MNVGANLWFGGHLFNSAKSQIEDEEKGLEMKNPVFNDPTRCAAKISGRNDMSKCAKFLATEHQEEIKDEWLTNL